MIFDISVVASAIYGSLPARKLGMLSRACKSVRPTKDEWETSKALSKTLYTGTMRDIKSPTFRAYTPGGLYSVVLGIRNSDTFGGQRLTYMGRPVGEFYFRTLDGRTSDVNVNSLRFNPTAIYIDNVELRGAKTTCKVVVVVPSGAKYYMDIYFIGSIDMH